MNNKKEKNLLLKDKLNEYKTISNDLIQSYLPDKEPKKYLYDLVGLYPARPGKGFRPGLCIATCKAFGGNVKYALRSAAALELFHNAFLVHDDIEDGSEFRRGLKTLHSEYGIGLALNAGDAMNVLSIRPLMENIFELGPNLTWQVFTEVEHMVRESVEGQAMELGWVRDNTCELKEDDYYRMTLKKTCWYTCIHPCRIGALIGTGGRIDLDSFNRFGYYMGTAFQIQDDILNLIGDEDKYGKEIGGDIREGKRTLILIHVFNNCDFEEFRFMEQFLSLPRQQRKQKDIKTVYSLINKYNSIEYSRSAARQLAGAALREFFVAFKNAQAGEDKEFIQNIVLYMIERDL